MTVVAIDRSTVHWMEQVVVMEAHGVVVIVAPMQERVVVKIATSIVVVVVAPRCAGGKHLMGSPSRGLGQK